jgi:outer membrane murein-binding lipoprotein Lpp
MNIAAVLDEVLQELRLLREENAQLHTQVAELRAKLDLLEHKVDTVAEEMGMI